MSSYFNLLKFGQRRVGLSGVQAVHFFKNGYGVSVISGDYTYGGDEGLYELAVIKGNKNSFCLVYDTAVTEDVEGHLSEDEVSKMMIDVEALPREVVSE